MTFEGKTVLVTGGSRGIGKAIALEFASRGADIAFNYIRNHKAAAETQAEIEALGVRCLRTRAHLGDAEKIRALFTGVRDAFGTLDVLVNNAASGVQRSASELEEKHWDWTLNVNAKAPWLCAIEASKLMQDGGSIVNITSQGSSKVLPYYFSVGTSKAALEALTRYLAVELAPMGISVNAVLRRIRGDGSARPLSLTARACLRRGAAHRQAAWFRLRILRAWWRSCVRRTPP